MSDPDDMDKPITKRDLIEAFDMFLGALTPRFDALERKFETRLDEMNRDLRQLISSSADDTKKEVRMIIASFQGLYRGEIGVVDDKYEDLPGRVEKLEAAVFRTGPAAKRQRRR
jgi:hypothetical protein